GALDAQVRVSLRRWLRELHDELGLTTVFVTHDQEEALEMADRVAVMNRGRIEQVGTPEAIYREPATPFVCEFIGKANRIDLTRNGRGMTAAEWNFGEAPWGAGVERAQAYVRPEHLALDASMAAPGWQAQLRHVYRAGSVAHLNWTRRLWGSGWKHKSPAKTWPVSACAPGWTCVSVRDGPSSSLPMESTRRRSRHRAGSGGRTTPLPRPPRCFE